MIGLKPLSLMVAALLAATSPAAAQWRAEVGGTAESRAQVLTLDQDRLFRDSDFGRETMRQFDEEAASLAVENRRIEAELEREERALTQRRSLLAPEEFFKLANAFDARVVEIRAQQDAKTRNLAAWLDERRSAFFKAMLPVLTNVLAETGASVILPNEGVLIALSKVDVTDLAIRRANETLELPEASAPPDENAPATP